MGELSEQQILEQIAARLAESHGSVSITEVSRVVQNAYSRFEGQPVRDFVPLFVERRARAELAKQTHPPVPGTAVPAGQSRG